MKEIVYSELVKGDLGSVDAKTNDEGLRNQRSKVG
jgi:hypothetical protein